jgi:murein L,D-transpeptidase YcbB/YkuD
VPPEEQRALQKNSGGAADGVIDPRTLAFLRWTAPR